MAQVTAHSQFFQDEWVRDTFNGKRDGTFADIGAGDPFVFSNTAMLQRDYGWRGILCDNSTAGALLHHRPSAFITDADATQVDFGEDISHRLGTTNVDFLSLDLEPATVTLTVLAQLPLSEVRFALACIEHDYYRFGSSIRTAMRAIMLSHGYLPVAYDVGLVHGVLGNLSIEDWWAHPNLIDVAHARNCARTYLERKDSVGVIQDQ